MRRVYVEREDFFSQTDANGQESSRRDCDSFYREDFKGVDRHARHDRSGRDFFDSARNFFNGGFSERDFFRDDFDVFPVLFDKMFMPASRRPDGRGGRDVSRGGGKGYDDSVSASVREDSGKMVISLNAEGYNKEHLDVTVKDNAIVISGIRLRNSEDGKMRVERRFEKMFSLPHGASAEGITAKLKEGNAFEVTVTKSSTNIPII